MAGEKAVVMAFKRAVATNARRNDPAKRFYDCTSVPKALSACCLPEPEEPEERSNHRSIGLGIPLLRYSANPHRVGMARSPIASVATAEYGFRSLLCQRRRYGTGRSFHCDRSAVSWAWT